mmetsp:Transcript_73863/g.146450  ORF Transcript_73863/g.146450 Transcript_73863/m.146450 type:complete len:113 (-) Transcript_73863:149-487(-)
MSALEASGSDFSLRIVGISGEVCCLSVQPAWRLSKLRRLVARTLAFPAAELTLLDGDTELKDHNAVGERQQLTAVRLSPSAVYRKAKENMEFTGALALQRAKQLASEATLQG